MILPVLLYGSGMLRRPALPVTANDAALQQLLADMWETLYQASGVGLAAPQVNRPLRLFIVDSLQTWQQMDGQERASHFAGDTGIRETFINPAITRYSAETCTDTEGCLSIPSLAAEVERPFSITIEYLDAQWIQHRRVFSGLTARMIQHEYDHIEGRLYLDHLPALKRTLLKNKLKKITEGKVHVPYSTLLLP
jgi:peptide deformylase